MATLEKKAPIVTKEQLEKSDFTNLRDYLNDKKGLKRRDGKAPERKSDGSGSASSSKTAEKPKGKTASEYSRDTDEMRNLTRQKAAVMAFPSAVYDADTDRMRNQSRKEARFEGAKKKDNATNAALAYRYNSIQDSASGYKKGGSVSSASKRADGCAQRGKTRA